QCEACDVPGGLGTCVPISGAPHGTRPACAPGTADEPCAAERCNGIERSSCKGLVGSEVVCRAKTCSEGVMTLEARCDGFGACPAETTQTCEPYRCAGDACSESCATDDDCTAGSRCDTNSQCKGGSVCRDARTLVDPKGHETDCAPYICAAGSCKQ